MKHTSVHSKTRKERGRTRFPAGGNGRRSPSHNLKPGSRNVALVASLLFLALPGYAARAEDGGATLPESDELMKAMADELERSMSDLALEDLARPYFIQYKAQDRLIRSIRAVYGGLVQSRNSHTRSISSRVRVGSYELDNTNTGRSFGRRASLPLDDDYAAIRHSIWRMTDGDYKQAVEMLTRKQAYLRQKNVEDRPDDFIAEQPVREKEPSASFAFDVKQWEENVTRLSARFERYPDIQDAEVTLFTGAVNEWIVNSEGTRVRTADVGVNLEVSAEIQAEDGMRLSDGITYLGLEIGDLPSIDELLSEVDKLCQNLIELSKAPVLEQYTGPVLFEPKAAGTVFETLLGDRLCARPLPLGGGWEDQSFERKIGLRILPRSFEVYDDPGPERFNGKALAGAYSFDDEAIRHKRVSLVERGKLQTLLAGRSPTKKIKATTGHGRGGGFRDAQATVGCLYITDADGLSAEELKTELIEAAREEGLPFALRVASMRPGGRGGLGDPIYAYKVYVEDGREELVRGLEFLPVEPRSLKRLLAAGKDREVYNSFGRVSSSYIVPAIVFEELDLHKIDREFDKLPIVKSPAQRHRDAEPSPEGSGARPGNR